VVDGPGAKQVREGALVVLLRLYVWLGHAESESTLFATAEKPAACSVDLNHIVFHLREALIHGPTESSDPLQDAPRKRALRLLGYITTHACEVFHHLQERHGGQMDEPLSGEAESELIAIIRLIDAVATHVSHAPGLPRIRRGAVRHEDLPDLSAMQVRFYRETRSIVPQLLNVGLPSATHHLLEMLHAYVPIDPRGIFLDLGRAIAAGRASGYQYESLAADLVVDLVTTYLADHRALLQNNPECHRTLLDIMDIFVEAGWPQARKLTYRLSEVFR